MIGIETSCKPAEHQFDARASCFSIRPRHPFVAVARRAWRSLPNGGVKLVWLVVFSLALLALPAVTSARAAGCAYLFAGGQPPALINPKLAQRTTMLCNDAFASLASGVTHGAMWSAEHPTADSLVTARGMPRHGEFHPDDRLPPGDGAQLNDYRRSGFDRGHMTPSGDMPNERAQQQSFSLANMVPQTAVLNRGIWAQIESAVRNLAVRQGGLYVVTGPAFSDPQIRSIGPSGVLVPSSTWKAVYDPRAGKTGAYICTNTETPDCQVISVVAVVKLSGVDPFPALATRLKESAMPLPGPGSNRYGGKRQRNHGERRGPVEQDFGN